MMKSEKIRQKRILILSVFIILMCASVAYTQDAETLPADSGSPESEVVPDPGIKAEKTTAVIKEQASQPAASAVEKDKTKTEKPAPAQPEIPRAGLLSVSEGDYLYARIPGISIQPAAETREITEFEIPAAEKSSQDKKDESSLSDIIKIIMIILIVVVIILLKLRSRRGGGSVLRRFPGA